MNNLIRRQGVGVIDSTVHRFTLEQVDVTQPFSV
jgi:hypothetical protein